MRLNQSSVVQMHTNHNNLQHKIQNKNTTPFILQVA